MTKIGTPLENTYEDSGFDKFMSRPYEGLGQANREWQESQGYSYDELKANMEGNIVKNFTTTIAFTSTDYRTATWSTGTISYQDGLVTPTIATSNTGNMTVKTYIYYDPQASKVALYTTTTAITATQGERLLLAIAVPNANTAGKAEIQTFNSTGMYIANLTVEHLTSGSIRSKTVTLAVTAGTGDCYFNAGKTDYDNTVSGFILGIDDSDLDLAKFYIGNTTSYLNWTGTALNIAGAISASTIDIGGADATSFHVDVNGNIWSGAAAYADGIFKVSSAGALTATGATISGAISASTIVGTEIKTSASGSRVVINADLFGAGVDAISFIGSDDSTLYLYNDNSGHLNVDGGDFYCQGNLRVYNTISAEVGNLVLVPATGNTVELQGTNQIKIGDYTITLNGNTVLP